MYVTVSGGVVPSIHTASPTGCVVILGPCVIVTSTGIDLLLHPDAVCVISTK